MHGADALRWLDALVSADLDDLAPGRARRAAFLSPTGAVLAEFTVAAPGGSVLLLQDPAQPRPIDHLLAPYVLSSDVRLSDRTGELGAFAFPGRSEPPDAPGGAFSAPSALGLGVDVICLEEDAERLRSSFSKAFVVASQEDVEKWRVRAGIARFAIDASSGDLPMECGLEGTVDVAKGCFLGQEAVAKVQNLGHPRRVLLHLEASGPVHRGDVVLADGEEVGAVTSAAAVAGHWYALAKVRWGASPPFRSVQGVELRPPGPRT